MSDDPKRIVEQGYVPEAEFRHGDVTRIELDAESLEPSRREGAFLWVLARKPPGRGGGLRSGRE